MDIDRVNAAVKIKIQIDRMIKKQVQLHMDLARLKSGMNVEELGEFNNRVAR